MIRINEVKQGLDSSKEDLFRTGFDEIVSRYGEFCCEVAATTVEHFCKVLKNYINNEQSYKINNCFTGGI